MLSGQNKVRVLFFLFLGAVQALDLPSYVKPCARDDPKLDECILKSFQGAFTSLLPGDRKYKIPLLEPLSVDKLQISQGGFKLTMTNIVVRGIKDIIAHSIRMDLKGQVIHVNVTLPNALLEADYDIDGKILLLPINGKGRINVTFIDENLICALNYEIYKKADGLEYIRPTTSKFEHKEERVYIYLTNLFNGDKNLGDVTNKFLDDNWREVVQELGAPMLEGIGTIVASILTGIGDTVPFKSFWAK